MLAVGLAATTILAARLANDDDRRQQRAAATTSPIRIGQAAERDTVDDEWELLPPAPLAPRIPGASVWTGTEMIIWGGWILEAVDPGDAGPQHGYSYDPATGTTTPLRERSFVDGAAYNHATQQWRTLPKAPIEPALGTALAVWTGSEMLLIGRTLSTPRPCGRTVAAAYDPASDDWRVIAEPPEELDCLALTVVWTGSDAIAWGGVDHGGADVVPRGALYDPVHDEWAVLPEAPIGNRQWHTAVSSGTEMIVWGGTDLVGLSGRDEEGEGAAFNPETRTWRSLPAAPILGRDHHHAVWTGSEMIVWGGTSGPASLADGAAYNPATDTWRSIAPAPIGGREWATVLWTDGRMVVWGGYDFYGGEIIHGDGAMYDPHIDTWQVLPESVLAPRCSQAAAWTGRDVVLWGGTGHCGTYGPAHGDGATYRVADTP